MSPENKKKTNELINPNWTKKEKLVYFLWLDEQVMNYWSYYLDLKFSLPNDEPWPKPVIQKLNEYLEAIEYFEKFQKEISKEFKYREIDQFAKDHPELCSEYTFFKFLFLTNP